MKSKKNVYRKAVSPLIATVLLIAITLAIGGFMSMWTQQVTRAQTDEASKTAQAECQYVYLSIENARINTSEEADNKTALDILNTGTRDVTVNKIQVIYDDDISTYADMNATIITAGERVPVNWWNTTTNDTMRRDVRLLRLITTCPRNANIEVLGDEINGTI